MSEKKTHHEKYDSKNPIAQKMLSGFMNCVTELVEQIESPIHKIIECGCGQGHVNQHLESIVPHATIKGFDINPEDLEIAKENKRRDSTQLYLKSIYDIGDQELADLVVCCEVLEHLESPELALRKMSALKANYYLFSVPREPLWRILNFMRGKYLKDWGNTPDHRNHWSTQKFISFISTELEVITVKQPLPWTMLLAKSKS